MLSLREGLDKSFVQPNQNDAIDRSLLKTHKKADSSM
jgi:hypothetical protein